MVGTQTESKRSTSMLNKFDIAIEGALEKSEPRLRSVSFGNQGDYVVLLHGTLRTASCMNKIAEELDRVGFCVLNFNYPANKYDVETLATHLKHFVHGHCVSPTKKIHFVGHSLGAIVIRKYLEEYPSLKVGRVVMLAPPNHGSAMASAVKNNFFFKWLCGPALLEICSARSSYVNKCMSRKVRFDLGVIAANKSINPFSLWVLKEPNDGLVSVRSTKVGGMKDHIVVREGHISIVYSEYVIKQIKYFLLHGKFYE